MTAPVRFRFGIPSADDLLHIPTGADSGLGIELDGGTASACISGPAGTGKSLFALHMASRYMADVAMEAAQRREESPIAVRVLYASTDLSHSQALKAWKAFDLANPNLRKIPFVPPASERRAECDPEIQLVPFQYDPLTLAKFLLEGSNLTLAFVDLQRSTAGDDWTFLNRIVATLPDPADKAKHLLVIDAVEGLETLSGGVDSYGISRSRRSRVAQILRTAGQKCHVVLIVEDLRLVEREIEENPEEYVTDIVLRLSVLEVGQYRRRMIEVVKSRFGSHLRGEHQLMIRDGKGSTTGAYQNHDDPELAHRDQADTPGLRTQAYVHVVRSLHAVNRNIMRATTQLRPAANRQEFAGFGIKYLDDTLGRRRQSDTGISPKKEGLPRGTLTALIGDEGTLKTRLAHAFIAEAFAPIAMRLARLPDREADSEVDRLILAPAADSEAAVYICTHDVNRSDIVDRCVERLALNRNIEGATVEGFCARLRRVIANYVICRRLEIHDLSSAFLMHIVEAALREAQRRLQGADVPPGVPRPSVFEVSPRIRLVIDDFRLIRDTYPDIRVDSLALPNLRFVLGREGVTALIVETQSGQHGVPLANRFDSELRALADHRLYTWRVPFQGHSRVAIAAVPPIDPSQPVVVRELTSRSELAEDPLRVDPRLELWDGLLEGNPKRVGLEIKLPGLTLAATKYAEQINEFLADVFAPPEGVGRIVAATPPSYESLRALCYSQTNLQLEQTLIFAVDEFWGSDRDTTGLRDCREYLETKVTLDSSEVVDPHGIFDRRWSHSNVTDQKVAHFEWPGGRRGLGEDAQTDRIPYVWDFGFLLCLELAWREAYRHVLPVLLQTVLKKVNAKFDPKESLKGITVRQVAEMMRFAGQSKEEGPLRLNRRMQPNTTKFFVRPLEKAGISPSSWRVVLEACVEVAAHSPLASELSPIWAFDVDVTAPESLSCLVLEMWMSEIVTFRFRPNSDLPGEVRQWLEGQSQRDAFGKPRRKRLCTLRKLVTTCWEDLVAVLVLLGQVFEEGQFLPSDSGFEFKPRPSHPQSVAARHWYSTATQAVDGSDERLMAVRLPGRFSVRGDWFLATASGSRSGRLADEALDLLSSRRANFDRLQWGIGLPTRRDIIAPFLEQDRTGIRTALAVTRKSSRDPGLTYGGLRRLGRPLEGKAEFDWFWRSQIRYYDRDRGVWLKWLWRTMNRLLELKREQGARWQSGFLVYDELRFLEGEKGVRKSDLYSELGELSCALAGLLPDDDRLDEVPAGRSR